MKSITHAPDLAGRELAKGDTVSTMNGQVTGKIWDLADDDGTTFVQLKPVHQPYAQPVWYASDQVIWVATAKQRDRGGSGSGGAAAASSPKASGVNKLTTGLHPDSPAPEPSPAKKKRGSIASKK